MTMPIKHVKRFRDRHGKLRCYHRPTGVSIKAEWGTPEFLSELSQLNGIVEAKVSSQTGTLRAVMDDYKKAPAFIDLAMATRTGYEKYFAIIKDFHDWPIKLIDTGHIAGMRDKISVKRGRRTANYVMSVLSVLFGFAIERKLVSINPVASVKRAKRDRNKPRANRPWTYEECCAVIDAAPPQILVPVALAMYTGLRKRDVLTLTKAELKNGGIETSKTGEELTILLHPELAAILAAQKPHNAPTVAATSRGVPWTSSGFDSVWDRFKRDLEKRGIVDPGLTMHGLRHTVGGLLADAGCDLDTIRRVLGQKTLTMAQLYSERAKKRNATRDAVAQLDPRRMRRESVE